MDSKQKKNGNVLTVSTGSRLVRNVKIPDVQRINGK